MENCSATVDFVNEWQRACSCSGDDCAGCPLSVYKNAHCETCTDYLLLYPEKAVEFLQKWSDTHPKRTLLKRLLEELPGVKLVNGTPLFTPIEIGYLPEIMEDYVATIGPDIWNMPEDELNRICDTISTSSSVPETHKATAQLPDIDQLLTAALSKNKASPEIKSVSVEEGLTALLNLLNVQ